MEGIHYVGTHCDNGVCSGDWAFFLRRLLFDLLNGLEQQLLADYAIVAKVLLEPTAPNPCKCV